MSQQTNIKTSSEREEQDPPRGILFLFVRVRVIFYLIYRKVRTYLNVLIALGAFHRVTPLVLTTKEDNYSGAKTPIFIN